MKVIACCVPGFNEILWQYAQTDGPLTRCFFRIPVLLVRGVFAKRVISLHEAWIRWRESAGFITCQSRWVNRGLRSHARRGCWSSSGCSMCRDAGLGRLVAGRRSPEVALQGSQVYSRGSVCDYAPVCLDEGCRNKWFNEGGIFCTGWYNARHEPGQALCAIIGLCVCSWYTEILNSSASRWNFDCRQS